MQCSKCLIVISKNFHRPLIKLLNVLPVYLTLGWNTLIKACLQSTNPMAHNLNKAGWIGNPDTHRVRKHEAFWNVLGCQLRHKQSWFFQTCSTLCSPFSATNCHLIPLIKLLTCFAGSSTPSPFQTAVFPSWQEFPNIWILRMATAMMDRFHCIQIPSYENIKWA